MILLQTYGKPLPPSDKICYPSSTPDPNALSLNGVSYGSITAPYGKDEVNEPAPKPRSERKPLRLPAIEAAPLSLEHGNGKGNSQEKSLVLHKGEESEENEGDHHDSLPGYDAGYCNGSSGELGYEYGQEVPQIPSGYALEAMDQLCESYLVTGLVFLGMLGMTMIVNKLLIVEVMGTKEGDC